MNWRNLLTLSATAALGLTLLPGSAVSQQKSLKEQIVGTWLMVSNVTTRPDGTKVDTLGPNPQAKAVFESNGRFSIAVMPSDLPKFAATTGSAGMADVDNAGARGSIAYVGAYSVNEADKSLAAAQIEDATFPNWVGSAQKQMIAFSGDELTQSTGVGSADGSTEIKWKRAK